jgi:phosphoribosylaminoimidazolecarboxamide formyltransferase / IMP cyclohydrolase
LPDSNAALISVHDRTGVVELARKLIASGTTVYATGGTAAHLRAAGLAVSDVEDLTGFPALFDGRVKTLHPNVFGGILRDTASAVHDEEAARHKIPLLSTIVVNLYPFESTVARGGATLQEAIEQIDIGGVALLRAAAKNFERVTVLSDPEQYAELIDSLPTPLHRDVRRRLATRAFERTAEYDSAISRYLESGLLAKELPGSLALTIPIEQPLRYGENPQDRAAFYLARETTLPEQLWGKSLSYNNLLDLDATLRMLVPAHIGIDLPPLSSRAESSDGHQTCRAAIVKHTVPCGVAERSTVAEAVRAALDADPISAYGGIIAVDAAIDLAAAEALGEFFLEIVAAPAFDADALTRLKRKKNLRIMRYDAGMPQRIAQELRVRSALGGVLAEDDDPAAAAETWRVVSKRAPEPGEWRDLIFAWDVVRHVKSNGVAVVRDVVSRGICAGQTNRVSAVRIAGERAGSFAQGAACASDGFFPFADGLVAAADAGCTAVIAPSGSIRDAEVIAAADERNIALVFSNYRYFLH